MTWPSLDGLGVLVDRLADGVELPRLRLVHRPSGHQPLTDVNAAVAAQVRGVLAARPPAPGPVAVAVGSRGIAHLQDIVRAVLDELKAAGLEPFIVPAMGSHGGGTVEGQTEVLAGYGITEAALGVPVRATMDTVVLGEAGGVPVHTDRIVVETGRVFLVSRIKAHTDFTGPYESGPVKMAAIGLGKQAGAQTIHSRGVEGLRDVMPMVGRHVVDALVIGALAIVEDDQDETHSVTGLLPEDIGRAGEQALLEVSRGLLPRIPFSDLDVLVIDRMGKDISGTGMDPNVLGRWMVTGLAEPSPPVRCIVTLDLTDSSHGNAIGVGLADIVPVRLVDKLDLPAFYMNALTSGWAGIKRSRLPMVLPTDRDAVRAAVAMYGRQPQRPLRLAWIGDTLHTGLVAVSEALVAEADGLDVSPEDFAMPFDHTGRLAPLRSLS